MTPPTLTPEEINRIADNYRQEMQTDAGKERLWEFMKSCSDVKALAALYKVSENTVAAADRLHFFFFVIRFGIELGRADKANELVKRN